MAKQLLSLGALASRYQRSERTINRWKSTGRLPKPDVLLPGDKPGWFESTIERHERRGFAPYNLREATV